MNTSIKVKSSHIYRSGGEARIVIHSSIAESLCLSYEREVYFEVASGMKRCSTFVCQGFVLFHIATTRDMID